VKSISYFLHFAEGFKPVSFVETSCMNGKPVINYWRNLNVIHLMLKSYPTACTENNSVSKPTFLISSWIYTSGSQTFCLCGALSLHPKPQRDPWCCQRFFDCWEIRLVVSQREHLNHPSKKQISGFRASACPQLPSPWNIIEKVSRLATSTR